MKQDSHEMYVSRSVAARRAEVVSRFAHPVTDAPMVTWYQTSTFRDEGEAFYSASEKEFHGWFESLEVT